jgi:uncharacterized membrane protein/rubredoxin
MRKWECTVCGYVHEGDEPPDECPVCSADKSMFVEITGDKSTVEQETAETSLPAAKPTMATVLYTKASELISTYHLHPITVHTPNGIVPMAIIFLAITVFFGFPLFETAALYSLVFVLLNMPLVIFTGYEMWQKRYQGTLTTLFKIKIAAAIVTVLALSTLIIWRLVQPDIVTVPSSGRWVYLAISLLLLMAVGVAGHMGGKLVFGSRKN